MGAVIVSVEIGIDSLEDFAVIDDSSRLDTLRSIQDNLQSAFEGANVEPKFRVVSFRKVSEQQYVTFAKEVSR